MLEKRKISNCLTFPLFLSPCSQSLAALRKPGQGEPSSGSGVTQTWLCIGTWLLWVRFFQSLPHCSQYSLVPCSRSAVVPLPPIRAFPQPLLFLRPARGGRSLFSCPLRLFPSTVHPWGNKGLPRVPGELLLHIQATLAKSHSWLPLPGPGGA